MNIFKKSIPACVSVAALAGLTRPTIFANVLKVIGNIPAYIEAYEEVKKSFSDSSQENGNIEKTLTNQETVEE